MSDVTSTSELTTKEIVKQAIQDYHESILPYLNGQVPTIANKFDKANLYSLEEKIVGTWIDGKPIYQKTLNVTLSDFTGSGSIRYYNLDDLTIEKPIKCNGMFLYQNDGSWITLPDIELNGTGFNGAYSIYCTLRNTSNGKGLILFMQTSVASAVSSIILTIQYTKTTDESIAIGSDTDYSTTEKIVGTWIDGKPLYQKTFTGTTPTDSGELNTGLTDIDFCKLKECIIQGYVGYSLNIAYKGTEVDIKTDGTKIYFSYNADSVFKNSPFYATLQYTKSTD